MTSEDDGRPWPWSLDVGMRSDVGGVRDHNEDSVAADVDVGLFVVADGMGGHRAGDRASAIAVATISEFLRQATAAGQAVEAAVLGDAIRAANEIIVDDGAADESREGMGSTVTALVLLSDGYVIGHVGDSRAWRVRGGRAEQLTEDHSLVAEQVREGVISPEQAEGHPMRNVLSRSLGAEETLEVDLIPGEVVAGDVFVLATDGLVHGLAAQEIGELVDSAEGAQAAADTLVSTALGRDDTDNATVLVLACGEAAPES